MRTPPSPYQTYVALKMLQNDVRQFYNAIKNPPSWDGIIAAYITAGIYCWACYNWFWGSVPIFAFMVIGFPIIMGFSWLIGLLITELFKQAGKGGPANGQPQPIPKRFPDIPPGLEAIMKHGLAASVARRMLGDLGDPITTESIQAAMKQQLPKTCTCGFLTWKDAIDTLPPKIYRELKRLPAFAERFQRK